MIPAAHAVLDLAALNHNLQRVRESAPGAKIMAVIKANGYGHGMVRIAKGLSGVDAFAVARVDEGIRLRYCGIETRIAVLEGFATQEELDLHQQYDLEPIIHAQEQVKMLEACRSGSKLSVWLKLDSGMHRLGFAASEYRSVYQCLSHCNRVKAIAHMTHFANADDLEDPTTPRQIELFRHVTADHEGERSVANSAGVLGWKESHSDWVRPGLMLLGGSPFPGRQGRDFGLRPVMSLRSRILSVKKLLPGDAVGYGGTWVCQKPTLMGVVAAGYGDGYPRHAKTGTPALVNGKRASVIGRISMDMITLDLSACPEAKAGDSVILWGADLPVEEIARYADTISYTLLCGVTQRVRVFEEGFAQSERIPKTNVYPWRKVK
ncbi:MAG: alanine racemase [Methylococcales bacterium]